MIATTKEHGDVQLLNTATTLTNNSTFAKPNRAEILLANQERIYVPLDTVQIQFWSFKELADFCAQHPYLSATICEVKGIRDSLGTLIILGFKKLL